MAHQLRMVFAFVKGCKKQNENMQQRRCVCVCVLSRSVVSYALRPCGLYSLLGFSVHGRIPDKNSRQEHWSGLPFPPAGDLPDPGTEPASLTSPALAGGFFTTTATWEASPEVELFPKDLLNSFLLSPFWPFPSLPPSNYWSAFAIVDYLHFLNFFW